jgi:hypothetical protein
LKKRADDWRQRSLYCAHARSLGLRLVTNNTAEFGRVKGYSSTTTARFTAPVLMPVTVNSVDH